MNLVRLRNKADYIKLIKFMYNEKHFGCIEDWDYFFSLDIFSIKENEEWDDYIKRITALEHKDKKQIVEEYNGQTGQLPEDNMFPCIVIYDFDSSHDRFGRMELQIFQIIPESNAKTIDQLMGIKSPNKRNKHYRKTKANKQ